MKNYKTVISLMSGTSVDTVDDLKFEIVNSYSMSYPDEIREKILELANGNANIRDVCYMNFVIGELFAKCVNLLLKKSNFNKENVDFWLEKPRQMLRVIDSYETMLVQKDKDIFYINVESAENE